MPERHRPVVRARWRSRVPGAGGVVLAVAWLAYFAVLQWSVVRYRIPIVAVLTLAAVGLALWQWRGWRVSPSRGGVMLMLAGSALATAAVPLFSYLAPTGLAVATSALVVAPLACAVALWSGRGRGATTALAAAVAGYAVAAATAVVSSPRPRIDVWVTLQQASDGLAGLENFYAMTWTGSPGIQDAFTYLPWTVVLLAPGRWLAGDVRWALAVWTLVAALAAVVLARRAATPAGREPAASAAEEDAEPHGWWTAAVVVCLLLLAPGTLTQLDQAWTEPLLLAGIAWWAVLVRRGHAWWAVVPLALACASKQHLALLLPVLLLWRPFGWQRTVATGALTGVLIAPWFLASPADFVHDTVSLLVTFHPIKFANTLYLLAYNTFGVTLPFAVTGLVVLGTLAAVCLTVWRRQPDLASLLRWLALVLLVANLVNKQAFYNQFWLVGALVVLSLAVPEGRSSSPTSPSGYTVSPRR
ncbi:glycosyltransferase 87 family protein [Phycicoccus sp. 3266]|uniref:glycosyltransferase 87 family protein n=1 Tax=Phycicoccus sp. 3266 TaxID=2817751 RepID=UPI002864F986|nr:glycosyltransferase 87 family protein [Phycicoccus sp. 3266]MDR6864543.1 FtsH-binding integral membrane protein [Phycicoccus sp. 3266]